MEIQSLPTREGAYVIGTVATLDDAIPALNPTQRRKGKTVIRVRQ
jgi:hypothetical protein